MLNRNRAVWKSPFILFTLLMLVKIYAAWLVIFGASTAVVPLIAGIPSVWVVFCLIEWLASKRRFLWYLIVDAVLTSIYFAAIMYYKYYGVIVTYRALQQAGQVTQVKGSVIHLMHPYFLLIYTDVVVLLGLYFFRKRIREWGREQLVHRRVAAVGLLISLMLCFGIVWANKGIVNEIKKAEHMGILNYEVYTILSDLKKDYMDPSLITPETVRKVKGVATQQEYKLRGAAEGRNVIVIQMEAFQNFLVGLKLDGREVTPNLNRLVGESLYFPHFYQQVGQGNTSDAEYVMNTSLYIPPNGAASQTYASKELPSLPKLFRQKGYRAVTFHTNAVQFWNRGELYEALGFDRYYDRDFFKDEDFLFFGSSDPVLYRRTAEELAKLQRNGKPVYAQVISMSSHHPFTLPEERRRIDLPNRFRDTFVGDYLAAANYADHALGQFVDMLKKNGVWDNSMIVLYGDHLGLPIYSLTADEKQLLHDTLGREYSYPDMMNIPMLISVPGAVEPGVYLQTGGQVDLMPTIANLAGISLKNQVVFGQDLLNQTNNILPQRYYLPTGSFISESSIFVPGKGYEDGIVYPLPGSGSAGSKKPKRGEYERALQLLVMCDSYVKHLPDRKK